MGAQKQRLQRYQTPEETGQEKMIAGLLLFLSCLPTFASDSPSSSQPSQSDLLGKDNWNTFHLLDELPTTVEQEPEPEQTEAPNQSGAELDSRGRAYVIRIEKREVNGQIVWRVWQQYLDMPESTAWADY